MRLMRRWDRTSRRAAAALGAAAVLLAASVAGALRVSPGAEPGTPSAWDPVPPAADSASASSGEAVEAAVASAPFRPRREPPARRYVPPSERSDRGRDSPARNVRLQLVGTALLPGQPALAALRFPDGRSRVFRAGATVEGLTVVRVEAGRVTLRGTDTTVVLEVRRPGAEGGGR